MGGPNFPTNIEEQKIFLKKEPWIDYYVIKEGEYSLLKLVQYLMNKKKNKIFWLIRIWWSFKLLGFANR